jgi:catechol 2,3-dioxygenase-like lactoylglutathione lyase family enzyme
MLSKYELIGFIPIVDAERARHFYVDILKFDFISDDPFAVVVRSKGNMIRLVRMEKHTPASFTILGWETPDIFTAVKELLSSGVIFERYSFLEQDDFGIWKTPDGSKVAWFKDPDGNVLSLSQH